MWSADAAALSVDGWQPNEGAVIMQSEQLVKNTCNFMVVSYSFMPRSIWCLLTVVVCLTILWVHTEDICRYQCFLYSCLIAQCCFGYLLINNNIFIFFFTQAISCFTCRLSSIVAYMGGVCQSTKDDWPQGRGLVCVLQRLIESTFSKQLYLVINESVLCLSLIHIWRCRRIERCRSRWSPYH